MYNLKKNTDSACEYLTTSRPQGCRGRDPPPSPASLLRKLYFHLSQNLDSIKRLRTAVTIEG